MSPEAPWKLIALLALVALAFSLIGLTMMAKRAEAATDIANRTARANENFQKALDYVRRELDSANATVLTSQAQVEWLRQAFFQNQQEAAKTFRSLGCEEFRNVTAKDGTPIEWAFRCRSPFGQMATILLGESLVPPQPTRIPSGAGV